MQMTCSSTLAFSMKISPGGGRGDIHASVGTMWPLADWSYLVALRSASCKPRRRPTDQMELCYFGATCDQPVGLCCSGETWNHTGWPRSLQMECWPGASACIPNKSNIAARRVARLISQMRVRTGQRFKFSPPSLLPATKRVHLGVGIQGVLHALHII